MKCDVADVVDFISEYVTEWNYNKTKEGDAVANHIAADVNEPLPHTATLSIDEMLSLLRDEKTHER